MKILVTGDIHMGRTSSRLGAATRSGDPAHTSAAAWNRAVDVAVSEAVSAVCLTGDVIDSGNAFWETTGAFRAGVELLANAGIRTLAVSGNHDWDVFPRLTADLSPNWFHLVGRNGPWERVTLKDSDGRDVVHIDGWSFPSRTVTTDPTERRDLPADPHVPVLAMVHGDLDVRDSRYAPLSRKRLGQHAVAGWLLGHIHAPLYEEGPPFLLYPGSLQALDPGETGPHGAWLIEIANGRVQMPRHVPLSSVIYAAPEYDVSSWTDFLVDAQAALLRTARALASDNPEARVASLRPVFRGRTPLKHVIPEEMAALDQFTDSVDGLEVVVDRTQDHTAPDLNLEELASRPGAPGELARLVLALDGAALPAGAAVPDVQALVRRARRAADMSYDVDDATVARTVRQTSLDLLDRLMS